jgi:hypothetical protein
MRCPPECYQIEAGLAAHLGHLPAAQRRGLALWVLGTVLAGSACQNAVLAALLALGSWHALRQRLREWLYDGADKAAPCRAQVEVEACFAPLLGWVLAGWPGGRLALAVDATLHGDRTAALVVSVLYNGGALPVAWHILPANQAGAWLPPFLRLLRLLRPAVPAGMTVLVLADRGLWSPRLWKRIRDLGWHPLLRVRQEATFAPAGRDRCRATALVAGPGHAWAGKGVAFAHRAARRAGTLVVAWAEGQAAPWVLLTDLPPDAVGAAWYGLRMWAEAGFRALKGVGWQWQHTRRTDPDRVARHWLVLAVATLWVVAAGTRAEVAARLGVPPDGLDRPPAAPAAAPRRAVGLFRRGLAWLRWRLAHGRPWPAPWFLPDPWPAPPPTLRLTLHHTP